MRELRARILSETEKEPLTSVELFERLSDVCADRKQLSNALYQMSQAGEIARGEDKKYTPVNGAPAVRREPAPRRKRAKARGRASAHAIRRSVRGARREPEAAANGSTGEVLEQLLRSTQEALDRYCYSVGDKEILDNLMAARNAAREAFRKHIGGEGA